MRHQTSGVRPRQTMRGHKSRVTGAVHLPGGRRIMTCSWDGSLRLWDLESGAQIGEDWRDEEDEEVYGMALSPNGKTIVSGSGNGKVKLWDVKTGKVFAKWTGHTERVTSVCWSADGKRVLSGSRDGTARIWDVDSETGETVLTIKTGHKHVFTVVYSPDHTKIGTGGYKENAVKIWDENTGELLATLKHDPIVFSLAWTTNGKKLISASSYGPIRIFDTTVWEQTATLEGHTNWVTAITLSQNDRLLVSASDDDTVRLWNLDTNLQVGPPLQHEDYVNCAALSADIGQVVTGSSDRNIYIWDMHAILKESGLEDLLPPLSDVAAQVLASTDADATHAVDDKLSPGSSNDVTNGADSSRTYRYYHRSSSRRPRPLAPSLGSGSALLGLLSSPFRRSPSNTNKSTEHQ
ncbi:WD40 repeat-like protein [Suillus hirtellus]|nr:WD40 repeat-like protein [Suillus hirtellus]